MRLLRTKRLLLVVMIAAAALAQTASEKPSVDVRRVGARLKCQCGCPDSVATCSMLECHFSKPAKEKIAQMQAASVSDTDIVKSFEKEYGASIFLAQPNAFGWIVPYSVVGLGLIGIWAFIKRSRKAVPVTHVATMEIDDPALEKYKAQIEKDLANLE